MADTKTTSITWQGVDLAFTGTFGSGAEFALSSPPGPTAGSPMEFLLAGVAGCTAVDVLHILRKGRHPVTGLAVEISGQRAETYPMVYTDVQITYIIQGQGIDPRAVERAIELSQTTYCSASIIFQRAGVRLETAYRLEK